MAQGKDFVRKQANSGLVLITSKGCRQKKQTVYLKTLSKKEGGSSTPFQTNEKKRFFDKSLRGRGSQNILPKIEALYFV